MWKSVFELNMNSTEILPNLFFQRCPCGKHRFQISGCLKSLTLFDMGFFEPSVMGQGHDNFVVIALRIMKFGTDMKLDVFYAMVTS